MPDPNKVLAQVTRSGKRMIDAPSWRLEPQAVLMSVILGAMIWIYVDSRRMGEKTFEAKLEVSVPDEWEIEGDIPEKVTISVRGSRQLMAALKVDEVSLTKYIAAPGDKQISEFSTPLQLSAEDVRGLPPELSVTVLTPVSLSLRLLKLVNEGLRVEVETTGQPAKGYMVAMKQVQPWWIEVRVPNNLITESDSIKTDKIDVSGKTNGFSQFVNLQPFRKNGRVLNLPRQVYASVEIIEKPSSRILEEKIPVRVLNEPGSDGGMVLKPAVVTVTVEGFVEDITKLGAADVRIYVDERDKVPAGEGQYLVKCKSLPLKRGRVVKIEPDQVYWISRGKAQKSGDGR